MPVYIYTAVNQAGRTIKGRIDAKNDKDVDARVSRLGLQLVNAREVKSKIAGLGFQRKVSRAELAQFCFYVERLVSGGVPLLEGLGDVRDSVSNPALRTVVGSVIQEIEQGKTLSQALALYPKVFDQVFVSLCEAGEESGELDNVLHNLGSTIKWQADILKKTKSLFYKPLFSLIVVIGAAYALLVLVVPDLIGVIESLGQELPASTLALISTSRFLENNAGFMLGGIFGFYILIQIIMRTVPGVDYLIDRFKVRMPLFGSVFEKIILSRFANVFGLLYGAGISVIQSLKISKGVMGNKFLAKGMDGVIVDINNGSTLFNSFRDSGLFPPLVLRMIRLGESTGGVDSAMQEVKDYFDKDAEEAIGIAQGAIGPLMMLVIAGLLVWIILAVYGPLYDIVGGGGIN